MKKGIILYQSKYGATKKYADWLVGMTGFDCVETPKANMEDVRQYDVILLCGGIYASGIAGLTFLRKNISRLSHQKIAILCVGASPYDDTAFHDLKTHNLKDDLKHVPLFYARGAWDEGKMTFKDRTLCKLLQKSLAKKDPGTYEPWMRALMDAAGQACDWTDPKYLIPIQNFLEGEGESNRSERIEYSHP